VPRPRSAEEIQTIRGLVAAAAGLNEERGDTLTIENLPFGPPQPWADEPFAAERPWIDLDWLKAHRYELIAAAHDAHPRLLGAILDCAATALLVRKWIKVNRLPRMADWYHWVRAATEESAMGVSAEEFEQAFKYSRELSRELAIDASPIGRPLLLLLEENEGHWTGTSMELLEELRALTRANRLRRRDLPASPEALRHALKRIEPDLQAEGLFVTYDRAKSRSRERLIILELKR
jgi:hypothetical protein